MHSPRLSKSCLIGLAVAGLCGCGGETGPDGESVVTRPQNADSVAVGPTLASNRSAPLPFGMKTFPDAEQIGDAPDLLARQNGEDLRWLQYETDSPPELVIAFYKGQAAARGFNTFNEEAKPLARSLLLEASGDDGRILRVSTLVQKDEHTFIDLRIGTAGKPAADKPKEG